MGVHERPVDGQEDRHRWERVGAPGLADAGGYDTQSVGWYGSSAPGGRPIVVPGSTVVVAKSPADSDTACAWPSPHATASRRRPLASRSSMDPARSSLAPTWTTWLAGSFGPSRATRSRSPGARELSTGARATTVVPMRRLRPVTGRASEDGFAISMNWGSDGRGAKPTSARTRPAFVFAGAPGDPTATGPVGGAAWLAAIDGDAGPLAGAGVGEGVWAQPPIRTSDSAAVPTRRLRGRRTAPA